MILDNSRGWSRGLARAGTVVALLTAGAVAAQAGECPANKVVASGEGQKSGATMPKGVTDTVLGSISLADEPVAIKDRLLRLRKLVIKPGGVVPWHSHGDRPALIYVVQGEVTEYADTCSVPILHKAGDVASETHATSHWWKNTGKQTVVLLSSDLFPTTTADSHMM